MFFALASRLIITGTTLFPIYASYKALKANDAARMETLLMFWVVMGLIMTVENTVEWVINWIPFYFEVKTMAMLWLTLPQIQGSTYVYVAHLHPFLLKHEDEIDAAIADARTRASQAGLEWIKYAMQRIKGLLVGVLTHAVEAEQAEGAAPQAAQPAPPASPLKALAGNFVRQYGPMAMSAGNALFHPMNGRAPSVRAAPNNPRTERQQALGVRAEGSSRPPEVVRSTGVRDRTVSGPATLSRAQLKAKRAELEAQLASLDAASASSATSDSSIAPSASGSGPYRVSSSSSNARSVSAGPSYPLYRSAAPSMSNLSTIRSEPVSRVERSFVSEGYDEIRPEEAADGGPFVTASAAGSRRSTGGGWWFWAEDRTSSRSASNTATLKKAD